MQDFSGNQYAENQSRAQDDPPSAENERAARSTTPRAAGNAVGSRARMDEQRSGLLYGVRNALRRQEHDKVFASNAAQSRASVVRRPCAAAYLRNQGNGVWYGLANPVRNPWAFPGCADFAALCALDDGNEARCHGKDGCFPLNCGQNCGQNVYIVYKPAVFAKQTCRNRGIKQKILHRNAGFVVEHTGFEPVTSTMRM